MFSALCSHPVLALPNFTKAFQIESDVLDTAVGGVLTQEHGSIHKPIAFLRNILTSSEKITVFTTMSCLQLLLFVKAWHPYINGH